MKIRITKTFDFEAAHALDGYDEISLTGNTKVYSRSNEFILESKDFKLDLIDFQQGDEAGIKDVTFEVKGDYACGLMKSEAGVHRMVRISPFDSGARRHTSFASVWVYPVISEDIDIEISDKDLRIDTYRSSGAGGQHVNTTDSAVRITHIPTGIAVSQQDEKSQIRNKEKGLKILRSRIYELERQKRDEERSKDRKSKIGIIKLNPLTIKRTKSGKYLASLPDDLGRSAVSNSKKSNIKGMNIL